MLTESSDLETDMILLVFERRRDNILLNTISPYPQDAHRSCDRQDMFRQY